MVGCNPVNLETISDNEDITGEWVHCDVYSYQNIYIKEFNTVYRSKGVSGGLLKSDSFKKDMKYIKYNNVLEILIGDYWHKWKRKSC